jgi:hypothetical protein
MGAAFASLLQARPSATGSIFGFCNFYGEPVSDSPENAMSAILVFRFVLQSRSANALGTDSRTVGNGTGGP